MTVRTTVSLTDEARAALDELRNMRIKINVSRLTSQAILAAYAVELRRTPSKGAAVWDLVERRSGR